MSDLKKKLSRYGRATLTIVFFWGTGQLVLAVSSTMRSTEKTVAISMPDIIVFPWHFLTVLPELRGAFRKPLKKVQQDIARSLARQPQSLRQYIEARAPGQKRSLNALRKAETIRVGQAAGLTEGSRLFISPVMCTIGNKYLLFLTVRQNLSHTLGFSVHEVFDRSRLQERLEQGALGDLLQLESFDMWPRFLAELKTIRSGLQKSSSALQVGLSLTHNRTRFDQGSSHCLNLLLAEKLTSSGFKVTMPVADENMQTLRFIIPVKPSLRRPTRRVVLSWSSEQIRELPTSLFVDQLFSLNLQISHAEAVFGQAYAGTIADKVGLRLSANNQIDLVLPGVFQDLLQQERTSLDLEVMPRVSKIRGSWAYLDKGRAWGLKMSDRLVMASDENAANQKTVVKGHVVGFFGSSESLKSPSGYPIREGAIVYIRSGLKDLKIGDRFFFDSKEYPSR